MGCDAQLALISTAVLTHKVGQSDVVFGTQSQFISRSAHARLRVSVCNGYDLFHPG